MRIQIVCHDNNAGLSRDRQITKEVLEAGGHEVDLTNNKLQEFNNKLYDINIFHEIIDQKYYKQATKNIIIIGNMKIGFKLFYYCPMILINRSTILD